MCLTLAKHKAAETPTILLTFSTDSMAASTLPLFQDDGHDKAFQRCEQQLEEAPFVGASTTRVDE
jgi:hypothetical protein